METNIVQTPSGALKGKISDEVLSFHGVPYAQPPVGNRRFRSPVPIAWDGVRDATESGPASYQINSSNLARVSRLIEELDPGVPGVMSWPAYVGKTYNQDVTSEDCLYLDIWRPSGMKPGQRLPVYVYYHGGANSVSAGSFRLERGSNLARQENIIVVRPNYRMGALGWVHFSLISAEEFPEATNLGLQDQIAALRWVYDHIESLGGDRENITIGGESAGGTAVSHLLTYPGTQQLVRRAIIQSLSPFNVWCTQQKEEAAVIARRYLQLLRIQHDPTKLHGIDPDYFLAVHNILCRQFPADANIAWSPVGGVVDGEFIPDTPALALSQMVYPRPDFELMIGFAKDEWQFFRGHTATMTNGTEADALAIIEQVFGQEQARKVWKRYRDLYPTHAPGHLASDIMSMEFFKYSSLTIATNFAKQGFAVYVFQFSYDLPGLGGYLRAVHTGDVPFIFRNYTDEDLIMWPGFDGVDNDEIARISTNFGQLYGSFIKQGVPGSRWPAFSPERQTVLWVGKEVVAKERLLESEQKGFMEAGITSFAVLQTRILQNTRQVIGML
ncbi:hypothetical protein ASPZODRAFT_147787 [Penicilliopsis zonata CBS 506.65]|uniref:Carboxylesterase type B domain-containing protein n=1 Tax=Penicilliopsis zonata CBS 506.65 TaxID=1073090 RepID=A0A1L9S4K9_9EURO|nr:hypothetical protein ASPZODRAFT_147787 [Penicilliopsis zonata CBS 506.65]OJJ42082.1 hypothetical protein ASPZODRAFT_147787 [Penicilliopsis zonata CBS 506.65]